MSSATLSRVSAQTAVEVCGRFPIGDAARSSLRDDATPAQFLDVLIQNGEFADAVRFLGHALPKREAVWWACLAAREAAGAEPPPAVAAAIKAAEAWVADPTEENRRAAMPAAEAAEFRTPAGCAAAAAFWSGGSLGPPNVPVIPPGESLTAHGVAGAVMLAAVAAGPEKTEQAYKATLARGIRVANGEDLWNELKAPPKPPSEPTRKPSSTGPRQSINWE